MDMYRVDLPIFAILTMGDERLPMTIPVNAQVAVRRSRAGSGDATLLDVEWNATRLMVFAEDLARRATVLGTAARSE
ncbi:MAG TPA: hypothetical protein VER03_04365 [Bryobacteraceae bacterium]|nr:hypothetical protein [Bryobacteraceae bacterium]